MKKYRFLFILLANLLYISFSLAAGSKNEEEKQSGEVEKPSTYRIPISASAAETPEERIHSARKLVLHSGQLHDSIFSMEEMKSVNLSDITVLKIGNLGQRSSFTVDMCQFIRRNFLNLEELHIGSVYPSILVDDSEGFMLSVEVCEEIGKLNRLSHLEIRNSGNLTGIKPLGGLYNLTELCLPQNNISDKDLEVIGKLSHLEVLDISGSGECNMWPRFSGDPRKFIKNQGKRDDITKVGLDKLISLRKLRSLTVSHQFLGGKTQFLKNLTSLRKLIARDCFLRGEDMSPIGQLSDLEYLDLSYNDLSEKESVESFSLLSNLTTFTAEWANVNSRTLVSFLGLTSLYSIDVSGPYCEISPRITNELVTFLRTRKVQCFKAAAPFFSGEEMLREKETTDMKLFMYAKRNTMWRIRDIQELFAQLPEDFIIPVGLLQDFKEIKDQEGLVSSEISPQNKSCCEKFKECCAAFCRSVGS